MIIMRMYRADPYELNASIYPSCVIRVVTRWCHSVYTTRVISLLLPNIQIAFALWALDEISVVILLQGV